MFTYKVAIQAAINHKKKRTTETILSIVLQASGPVNIFMATTSSNMKTPTTANATAQPLLCLQPFTFLSHSTLAEIK